MPQASCCIGYRGRCEPSRGAAIIGALHREVAQRTRLAETVAAAGTKRVTENDVGPIEHFAALDQR